MDEHRRVVPTGLLDAHHHVWELAVRDQAWTTQVPVLRRTFTANQMAPHLEAAGVAATIVVQTVNSPDETADLLAAAADTPWMFGVVGWADLTSLRLADELARLRSMPGGDLLVGLRHQVQGESDPGWLCRKDVRRGLQVVAESNLRTTSSCRPSSGRPPFRRSVRCRSCGSFSTTWAIRPSFPAGRPSTSRGSPPSAPSLPHRTSRSSCLDWSHGPTRRPRRSLIWSHMFGPSPI